MNYQDYQYYKIFKIVASKKFVIVFVSILFSSVTAFSQQQDSCLHISAIFGAGGAWSGRTTRYYPAYPIDPYRVAPVHPGLASTAGIEVGPLWNIHGMVMYSSLDISFCEETFGIGGQVVDVFGSVQRVPVMLWIKLTKVQEFAGFVSLGGGWARTDFRMFPDYNYIPEDILFHRWNFCLGLGGGFRWRPDDRISIETSLNDYITFASITQTSSFDGQPRGLSGSYGLAAAEVRILYTP